jgi:hypothetical protein
MMEKQLENTCPNHWAVLLNTEEIYGRIASENNGNWHALLDNEKLT